MEKLHEINKIVERNLNRDCYFEDVLAEARGEYNRRTGASSEESMTYEAIKSKIEREGGV